MFNIGVLFTLCAVVCITSAISDDEWTFQFNSTLVPVKLKMGSSNNILFHAFTNASWSDEELKIQVISSDEEVAKPNNQFLNLPRYNNDSTIFPLSFNLTASFIGYTKLYFQVVEIINDTVVPVKYIKEHEINLNIVVVRKPQLIDTIFVFCVAILMSIIFINLGCALDVEQLKQCVRKPIAPAVTFVAQFILLPVISFSFAKLIFPNSIAMQLGLFFTGISPGGGASSVWSLLLGGNINLSIVLTTVGTLESFIMIPFWIIFLGRYIFSMAELPVPYKHIGYSIVALIIPLCIGYCIQRYLPRISRVMIRVLKPLSSCLIIFIIVFATVTNLYLFKIFSWKIILAGALIPWTGYLLGFLVSFLVRSSKQDIISMTVESGIQNTGIAIFMLKFSLEQPAADITTVIPVAVALMTPIPLLFAFLVKKFFGKKDQITENQDPATESMLDDKESQGTSQKVEKGSAQA